ncbi:hypothetical protein TRVL_06581 [Trypanosoma vivax]|nr:hypothetical protein TRVL_06581 [Trypanosoma vivax]
MHASVVMEIESTRQLMSDWLAKSTLHLRNTRNVFEQHLGRLESLLTEGVMSPRPDDSNTKLVDSLMVTPCRPSAANDDKAYPTPSMASPPVNRATLNYDRLLDEVTGVTRSNNNDSDCHATATWQDYMANDVIDVDTHKRPTPESIPEERRNCSLPKDPSTPCQVIVMFKRKRVLQFESPTYVSPGEYVVVGGDRGEDVGLVTHSWTHDDHGVNGENWAEGVGRVLRVASALEVSQLRGVQTELEDRAVEVAQKKVEEHCLPMSIVDAEYQFDRKKLTFYYRSHQRLDFRILVRDLYKTFRARIWMEADTP